MAVESLEGTDSTVVEPLETAVPEEEQDRKAGLGATRAATAWSNRADGMRAYNDAVVSGDLQGMQDNWVNETAHVRAEQLANPGPTTTSEDTLFQVMRLQENVKSPESMAIEDIRTRGEKLIDEDTKRNEAMFTTVRNGATQYVSDFNAEGLGSKIASIGGFAFLGKGVNMTIAEVALQAGYIEDGTSVSFDDVAFLRKHNNFYNNLPLEDQARLSMQYSDIIDDYQDNNLKKMEAMRLLTSLSFDESDRRLTNIFDDFVVFDAYFAAGLAAKTVVKSANIVNQMSRMRDIEAQAKIIQAATAAPENAAKMGVKIADVVDAIDITLPGKIKKLFTGEKLSLAAEVENLVARQSALVKAVRATTAERRTLSLEEEAGEVARVQTMFDKKDNVKTGSTVVKANKTGGMDVSFTKLRLDKNGVPIKGKETEVFVDVPFTNRGVKPINSAMAEFVNGVFALDPNSKLAGKMREWWVTTAESLDPERGRLGFALDKAFRLSRKGLNKEDKAIVETVLMRGDRDKKVWTLEELTNPHVGVGIEDITLTDKQARAYMGYRNMSDELFKLQDQIFRDNLTVRGMMVADLPTGAVAGKQWDNATDAWNAFFKQGEKGNANNSPHILVFGKAFKNKAPDGIYRFEHFSDLDDYETVQNWYNKGYRLMRADSETTLFAKGETRTQWALVRESDIKDPRHISRFLNPRIGYVTKGRKNGNWFVKVETPSGLSGAKGATTIKTMAWSDNKLDAEQHVRDLIANGDTRKLDVVNDRELTDSQLMYDSIRSSGSLFTGARKEEELLYVGKNGGEEFISSMEAMQRYINHIGRNLPMSMIRLSMEARALATADAITGTKDKFTKLSHLVTRTKDLGIKPKQQDLLTIMHDQISLMRNIPTDAERRTVEKYVELGTAAEKWGEGRNIPGWDKVPRYMYGMASKGVQPVDYIRSVTFMHTLGLWNPAQYLVQASATVVPMSINPILWGKAIPRTVGAHTLDLLSHSPEKLDGAMKWMKDNGMGEYVDHYLLWERSGMRESILSSNANYVNGFQNSLPFDAGVIGRTLGSHTFIYEAGELAQTRQAFFTAVQWYMRENKGVKIEQILKDDLAREKIRARTDIYRMNMSRMNQSTLNKGYKSIPLQFKQVISKYFSKVLPPGLGGTEELTTGEKSRLAAFPTIMFGVGSVPFVEPLSAQMMQMMGTNPMDIDPALARGLKYGAAGFFLSNVLQAENDLSSRMAMGMDVPKEVYHLFQQGTPVWKSLGPTGNVMKRYENNISWVFSAFDLYTDVEETTTFMQDIEVASQILVEAAADITPLTRNLKDYGGYIFTDNPYFFKNGENLIKFDRFSDETKFFAKFGFMPTQIKDRYDSRRILRDIQGGTNSSGNFQRSEAQLLARTLSIGILDTDNEQLQRGTALLWQAVMKSRPVEEWGPLMAKTTELMNDPKLDGYDTWKKLTLEFSKGIEDGINSFNPDLSEIGAEVRGQ